jgi:DHA1 family multidrug resistance protein-like MFS transporter
MDMKVDGLRATVYAALALAFASFGDAFLYPFLPVNFADVNVPVVWVGLLLSVNRFVRIVSNSLLVHAFARYGLRTIMICAVLLAITSTAGYGFASGLIAWLIFRIMWGLSFSAMRIGTLGYALHQPRQGFALGVSRSVQEVGPLLSLFMAPFLLRSLEPHTIFYVLALLSIPALYFAWILPPGDDKTQPYARKGIFHWPSTLNALTLASAIVIDGIVVVLLGILFLRYPKEMDLATATTLAAFYLGYRKVCLVTLSAAGGWVADHVGIDRMFNVSMLGVIIGLLIMVSGWISTGAIIVFTFNSINAAITPGNVSRAGSHLLAAVAENATWRDIGAAIGTLVGGLLLTSSYLHEVLITSVLILILLFLTHAETARKALKLFYSWK